MVKNEPVTVCPGCGELEFNAIDVVNGALLCLVRGCHHVIV